MRQDEWKRADQLCDRILAGNRKVDWGLLMEPFPFFTAYKNYIQVAARLLYEPESAAWSFPINWQL